MTRQDALLALLGVSFAACGTQPATPSTPTAPPLSPAIIAIQDSPPARPDAGAVEPIAAAREAPLLVAAEPPHCAPADWTARRLAPLLKPGKTASSRADRQSARQSVFDAECTDAPQGPRRGSQSSVILDGVEIRLAGTTPAGTTGRRWTGNQCAFEVRLADGSGSTLRLGPAEIPPFTTVSAVVRSGSAVWMAVGFNGYTAEFPKGGNRIIALDLCEGRVAWMSNDTMSNGGLLLLDDYLVSPYGFTSERRYVYVLDSHSGAVLQKLPVIENVCPSKSWAPHWHHGERCDAPGQAVGAATDPRVESGLFLVDTNTGSSSFQFR
ncbi:MAG: hypothetical protein ABW133_15535 [Polyangiaceae bacterium]